jgi:hypothetical protein
LYKLLSNEWWCSAALRAQFTPFVFFQTGCAVTMGFVGTGSGLILCFYFLALIKGEIKKGGCLKKKFSNLPFDPPS